jgi:hypothetical protein
MTALVDSFSNVPFDVLCASGFMPQIDYQQNISVRHIPNSNTNVINVGGLGPGSLKIDIQLFSVGIYLSLRAKLGLSGILLYDGGTYTAVLADLGNPRRLMSAGEQVHCGASFII